MAFIGFLQPASGGLLSMCETQARWFVELCKEKCQLPPKSKMYRGIKDDQVSHTTHGNHVMLGKINYPAIYVNPKPNRQPIRK